VATVSETYNKDSSALYDPTYALDWGTSVPPPSCQGWDGLVPGAKLSIIVDRHEEETPDCNILMGEVPTLPNGQNWSYDGIWRLDGGFSQHLLLIVTGETITGACLGRYDVLLEHPDLKSNVFVATDPGKIPNLVLGRTFVPTANDAATTCPACADSFVAFLAK
jgi:hypothetical protein